MRSLRIQLRHFDILSELEFGNLPNNYCICNVFAAVDSCLCFLLSCVKDWWDIFGWECHDFHWGTDYIQKRTKFLKFTQKMITPDTDSTKISDFRESTISFILTFFSSSNSYARHDKLVHKYEWMCWKRECWGYQSLRLSVVSLTFRSLTS